MKIFLNKIIFIVSCVLFISFYCRAQKIEISQPQKLNSKMFDFEIVGKNSEGILIHRFGTSSGIVEAYNDNMGIRWKKQLQLNDKNAFIKKLLNTQQGVLLFYYIEKKGEYSNFYIQRLKDNLDNDGNPKLIDSIRLTKSSSLPDYKIRVSKDRSKYLIYYPIYNAKNIDSYYAIAVENQLNLLWTKNIEAPATETSAQLEKTIIDNNGNAFFIFNKVSEKNKKQSQHVDKYNIVGYNASKNLFLHHEIKIENKILNDVKFEIDNVNNQIIIAGFYSDGSLKSSNGLFYQTTHIETGAVTKQTIKPFDAELITMLTGDMSKSKNELGTFDVKEILIRKDGGALVVAESFFVDFTTRNIPGLYGSYTSQNVNIYYYYDILVVSINPDGSIQWQKIIRKRQISEDDEGYYSSFCINSFQNDMHFIFNEDISKRTNIIDFQLDSFGELKRKNVSSTDRKGIMIVPRYGKQVSPNEILIPSIERSSIRFVKITF